MQSCTNSDMLQQSAGLILDTLSCRGGLQALTVASEKIKAARSWADSTLRYLDTARQVVGPNVSPAQQLEAA